MKCRYLITKELQKDLTPRRIDANVRKDFEDFCKATEEMESKLTHIFNNAYSRRYNSGARAIWLRQQRGEAVVYVLRVFYPQHDLYKDGTWDTGRWMEKYSCYTEGEQAEIDALLDELNRPEEEEARVLPELSHCERAYIEGARNTTSHAIFDEAIYETAGWLATVRAPGFIEFDSVADPLLDYIFENCNQDQYGPFRVPLDFDKSRCVFGYRAHRQGKDGQALGSVWILRGITKKDSGQTEEELQRPRPSECRRAYPYTILENKDLWREMETDPNSNFILSDEEVGVVAPERDHDYPLFISGRAGSGKSTVLQYMFADEILRYLKSRGDGTTLLPPIYLSYSPNLVGKARELSHSLFEKNHIYSEELERLHIGDIGDLKPGIDDYFMVFKELATQMIAEAVPHAIRDRFKPSEYITYSVFHHKWMQRFGKEHEAVREYGPDISWHVIRTYIKGWDSESLLTPGQYRGIGRSNQDVSPETYDLVYSRVWCDWYSKLEGAWDDQDLVRYCLRPDDGAAPSCVHERFSAVFCDEAQDFTRTEVDFILRISSFSNRRYQMPRDLSRLPFVFAGDEFQTLNPTGFSWNSLRSYLTKRLAEISGFDENDISQADPVPLVRNYRSTDHIVRLGNRIQLLREARFLQPSDPQEPHFSTEGGSIFCLDPHDKSVWDRLKKAKATLIVPAQDGQDIKDYIRSLGIPDGCVTFNEDGAAQFLTILNPSQAKGLEFDNLAVLGFRCDGPMEGLSLASLLEWMESGSHHPDTMDENHEIGLRYQINNAYVAVTRAKKKLFILDDWNEKSFWAFACAFAETSKSLWDRVERLEDLMHGRLNENRKRVWESTPLGLIRRGEVDDISGENLEDSKENSQQLEQRAQFRRDSGLFYQAAARYKEQGDDKKHFECKAYAALYDPVPNHTAAAELFKRAGLNDKAEEAYWHAAAIAGNWERMEPLLTKIASLTNRRNSITFKACQLVTGDLIEPWAVFDLMDQFCLEYSADGKKLPQGLTAWQRLMDQALSRAERQQTDPRTLENLLELRPRLRDLGIIIDPLPLIRIAGRLGSHDAVLELCEGLDSRARPREYYLAMFSKSEYPERINYLRGTEDSQWASKVVEEFLRHPGVPLPEREKMLVARCALDIARYDVATPLFPWLLSRCQGMGEAQEAVEKAADRINFNAKAMNALILARYNSLAGFARTDNGSDPLGVRELMEIVATVTSLQGESAISSLRDMLRTPRRLRSYLDDRFGRFARQPFVPILLLQLGVLMERIGNHNFAARYYDWAWAQTDDAHAKRQIELRLLACNRRYSEINSDPVLLQEVLQLQARLHVDAETKLPTSPDPATFCDWEAMYREAVRLGSERQRRNEQPRPAEPRRNDRGRHDRPVAKNPVAEAIQVSSGPKAFSTAPALSQHHGEIKESPAASSAPQAPSKPSGTWSKLLRIGNFKLRYRTSGRELDICYDDDESYLHTSCRNGKIEDGEDFALAPDGTLVRADGTSTPLVIRQEGDHVVITEPGSGERHVLGD